MKNRFEWDKGDDEEFEKWSSDPGAKELPAIQVPDGGNLFVDAQQQSPFTVYVNGVLRIQIGVEGAFLYTQDGQKIECGNQLGECFKQFVIQQTGEWID